MRRYVSEEQKALLLARELLWVLNVMPALHFASSIWDICAVFTYPFAHLYEEMPDSLCFRITVWVSRGILALLSTFSARDLC